MNLFDSVQELAQELFKEQKKIKIKKGIEDLSFEEKKKSVRKRQDRFLMPFGRVSKKRPKGIQQMNY